MAVAVVGTPNVQSNTASGSSKTLTFTSTTYGADEILTVDVGQNEATGMPSPAAPSGGGLTWTQIANSQGAGSNFTRTTSWWANTGAGGTYAVTQVTTRTGAGSLSTRGVLTRHSGAHLTVPVGQVDTYAGTATDPLTSNTNLNLLNVLAGSMLHCAGVDWGANATIALSFDSSIADTEHINANESGEAHFCVFRSTAAVPSNDADVRAAMDVSGATGNWSSVFYEILQAAAGGGSVTGTAVGAYTLTATAAGRPTTLGTAAASFALTATVAGRPTTLGTAAAAFVLTATAVGRPTTLGVAGASFALTATAAGRPTTLATAAAAFALIATASGTTTGVVTGTAVAAFTLGATATGTPTTLGVAAQAFTLTATAAGKPTTLGIGSGSYGLTASASATVAVVAVAVGVYTLTATVMVGFFGPVITGPLLTVEADDPRLTAPVDANRTTLAVGTARTTTEIDP